MGKIPTIAIIAVALVLIIGISAASYYFLIKPQQQQLAAKQGQLDTELTEAGQLQTVQASKAATSQAWLVAQKQLEQLRERKSIHISMYMPIMAMTTMWWEYRENLPRAVEKWVADSGLTITQGASMPAPSLTPPSVPASGFLQVPEGQTLNLTVTGTLTNIERLYKSLPSLPRVATIGGLALSGEGDILTARIPLTMYIIVEGAEAVAPPPAAAATGGMGGMGGGMGGMGGGMGGPPGAESAAGPPGAPSAGGPPGSSSAPAEDKDSSSSSDGGDSGE